MDESLKVVKKALVDVELDTCLDAIRQSLQAGVTAWEIVDIALGEGMKEVGELFEEGEYFLGELVMAGNIMKEAMGVLEGKFDTDTRAGKAPSTPLHLPKSADPFRAGRCRARLFCSSYRHRSERLALHQDRTAGRQ